MPQRIVGDKRGSFTSRRKMQMRSRCWYNLPPVATQFSGREPHLLGSSLALCVYGCLVAVRYIGHNAPNLIQFLVREGNTAARPINREMCW